MQQFERRSRKTKKVHADNDDNDNDNDDNDDNDDADDGHRVIARVTLTRWVWLKTKKTNITFTKSWIILVKDFFKRKEKLPPYVSRCFSHQVSISWNRHTWIDHSWETCRAENDGCSGMTDLIHAPEYHLLLLVSQDLGRLKSASLL